jgi:hypothetical protein
MVKRSSAVTVTTLAVITASIPGMRTSVLTATTAPSAASAEGRGAGRNMNASANDSAAAARPMANR